MKYIFRQTIWAVGQGGFSMGSLYLNSTSQRRLYTYVYDCGSDQLNALRREMGSARNHFDASESGSIDVVFLSHLDSDHVNGFDALCEAFNRQIDRVVLPYLDFESRYYLAGAAMANQNASGLFLEFLVDPVKWIQTRLPNADIVLLGPPPEDMPGEPAPDFPTNPTRPGSHDANSLDTHVKLEIEIRTSQENSKTVHKGRLQHRWMAIQPRVIGLGNAPILLLAHIPPRSDKRLNAFRNALSSAGFGALSAVRLRRVLENRGRREALKNCYSALSSDHNIVSIHLLVKSLCPSFEVIWLNRRNYLRHEPGFPSMGFLFSGDAKLSAKKYFTHWKDFYGTHLDDVGFFALPHHGSKLSFEPRLLKALPNSVFVAQAGQNGFGHPSKEVVEQIGAAGRGYHQVDSSADSRIDIVYKLS